MNSFDARAEIEVGGRRYLMYRLDALQRQGYDIQSLPYSLRILLENLLRKEDGVNVNASDVEALANWKATATPHREIAFSPARVLLQDFTGVPALVDLAAMRDAMTDLGGDPDQVNPIQPVELVIDHSVQVDAFASDEAFHINEEHDYNRNGERYAFLKWGQQAFRNFMVAPPNTGICHQVNLEYLARVVFNTEEMKEQEDDLPLLYPDTLVGTDSHTPMVNGLGVLGWGVGGIEAEAAMLGQAISMLIPQVIGFKISGALSEGTTATDLVLTVTEMLRKKGVVGKFVEFFGPGVASLTLADRATIGNMSPEYGATCAIFPVDKATLDYLRLTGRSEHQIAVVEAYMKEQGLFHDPNAPEPRYSDTLELDLSTVEPSIAGPRRPQDRIPLSAVKESFEEALPSLKPLASSGKTAAAITDSGEMVGVWGEQGTTDLPANAHCELDDENHIHCELDGKTYHLSHGSVVIAAITSCTNTSNPAVMLAAGLLAKKAVARGLKSKPWVKTSLAPGSKVVSDYYEKTGLGQALEQLGFNLVGYGCTTCIGNSGPLPTPVSEAIRSGNLVAASVLSGNRNFEGRIHSEVRANYLMSPPLVVAFALAGRVDIDMQNEALGEDQDGNPVYLRDIWPDSAEIQELLDSSINAEMFRKGYENIMAGDTRWQGLKAPDGDRFIWQDDSTYVRLPPYFTDMARQAPARVPDITGAHVLAWFGDSVTTDHISPAGSIRKDSPAGRYLIEQGVEVKDFNSYGARRGNHEVMVRGTFANPRIKNLLAPGTEGGVTVHLPSGEQMSIYDAAMRYQENEKPLIILAGKEYGSGSSRDWAAKGPKLQGVVCVIAESFERIHRSNLVGMGILPLQFKAGDSAASLGLNGRETYEVIGLSERIHENLKESREVLVRATSTADNKLVEFSADIRIDTPQEVLYYRHGGILKYELRVLLGDTEQTPVGALADQPREDAVVKDAVDEGSKESFPASDPPAY